MTDNINHKPACSFCGLTQPRITVLIKLTGGSCICDECIDLCVELVAAAREDAKDREKVPPPDGQQP